MQFFFEKILWIEKKVVILRSHKINNCFRVFGINGFSPNHRSNHAATRNHS